MIESRKMNERICIFSALYLPSFGGVEKFTHALAHALAEEGDRVTIVTSDIFGLPARETIAENIEVVRLPARSLLNGRLPLPRKDRAYRALMEELESEPFDHVLVNTRFYPHSLEGVKFARKLGVRPVVLDHGSAYVMLGNPAIDAVIARYEDTITRRLVRTGADFYGISDASARWLRNFDIEAVGIISNAIDADAFRAQASSRDFRAELGLGEDDVLVAFTGRLVREKGVEALVEAARQLVDRNDIAFAFAGEGPLETSVRDADANVHLLGRLDQPDIAALLLQADALCLPSRSEGFSTSLLEAAACGAVPIATDVGGAREIIVNESYGTILVDAEPATIASALEEFADHSADERRTMAQRLEERARATFNWNETAQQAHEACRKANLN